MLDLKWVYQMDIDPKHTCNIVANGLRTVKSRHWSGHHKGLTSIQWKICAGRTEGGENVRALCTFILAYHSLQELILTDFYCWIALNVKN